MINGYATAIAVAYLLIAVGAIAGIIPLPTLIALVTIPMALKVLRGMRAAYEDPYALMSTMATGVQLHVFTGLLLFVGYLIAIVASHLITNPPVFLR